MGEVFLDAFLDSLKILAVVVICNIIIALIEPKLSGKINLKGKFAPLVGASVGLLPQCGFSIVATDLYQKRHITIGTLVGVYIATSDEALPIFLAHPEKALHILPLLALKFVIGVIFGYLLDALYVKGRKEVVEHLENCDEEYKIRLTDVKEAQLIENNEKKFDDDNPIDIENGSKNLSDEDIERQKKQKFDENLHNYFWHPMLHSIKIFLYVFVVNIIFGIIIFYVGEDNLIAFLSANKYVAPLFAVLVGAVPNCAASVVLSELYIMGGLGFGATLGGLCMNAGLGFTVLLKNTKQWKNNLAVIGIMFAISLVSAYVFSAIFSFNTLPF